MEINLKNYVDLGVMEFNSELKGLALRSMLQFNSLDKKDEIISLFIPDEMMMTGSFVRGMFESSIQTLGHDKFMQKYKIYGDPDILAAIETCIADIISQIKPLTTTEMEYVLYAKIDLNLMELPEKADRIQQFEQWEIKSQDTTQPNAGTIRVRSIDDKEFILTTKRYKFAGGIRQGSETEIPVPREVFEDFKYLCPLGIRKIRHSFNLPCGLTYEIDLFMKNDGTFSDWVKIDLEVPAPLEKLPDLPIQVIELIGNKRTKGQQKFIKNLMDTEHMICKETSILPVISC